MKNPSLNPQKIQNLFSDQLIQAQSFIDVLGCSSTDQQYLKIQNGKNSIKKQAEDVYRAVEDLKNEIIEQDGQIYLEKVNQFENDQFMYQIMLPNLKLKNVVELINSNPTTYRLDPREMLPVKIRLSLSGGQLMIKTGGGFK